MGKLRSPEIDWLALTGKGNDVTHRVCVCVRERERET